MRHNPMPNVDNRVSAGHHMTKVNAYRASTHDSTADGFESLLGFIGGEVDHLLGQLRRHLALESLIRCDHAQLNGYHTASPNLYANGIRKPERNIVRLPEISLFTVTVSPKRQIRREPYLYCRALRNIVPVPLKLLGSRARDDRLDFLLALAVRECDKDSFEKLLEPRKLRTFAEVEHTRVELCPHEAHGNLDHGAILVAGTSS